MNRSSEMSSSYNSYFPNYSYNYIPHLSQINTVSKGT